MTIPESQKLIAELVKELGFDDETVSDKFLLLVEEFGEFAKATRKVAGLKRHDESKQHNLEEEAADIYWYLLDICNQLDIDLEKALRAKIDKNRSRSWA
jgi:NTP pyrophosphatase (non-canonical NTP hydrolase)